MAVLRRSVWGFVYPADRFPRDATSILYNTSFLNSKFNPEVWSQLGRGKHEPASSITTQVVSRDTSSRGLEARQSVGRMATVRRNWKARSAKSIHTACLMKFRSTRARYFKLQCIMHVVYRQQNSRVEDVSKIGFCQEEAQMSSYYWEPELIARTTTRQGKTVTTEEAGGIAFCTLHIKTISRGKLVQDQPHIYYQNDYGKFHGLNWIMKSSFDKTSVHLIWCSLSCRFVMKFFRLRWSVRIVNTSTATAVSPKAEGNAILLVTLYHVYIQYTCWDHKVSIEILLRHFPVCWIHSFGTLLAWFLSFPLAIGQ